MKLPSTSTVASWKDSVASTARSAVNALRLAGKEVTAGNVIALIQSAPHDVVECGDQEFRSRSFCRECLDLACDWVAYRGSPDDQSGYGEAERHFLVGVPALSADERELLEASFTGIIQGFKLDGLPSLLFAENGER